MVWGALLGAGVGLADALLGADAQQDANNINWMNLFETKRRNRETEKLAKSSRRDAYGNLLKYTPGIGWEIDTTPMTESILGAQQKEELESLRKDAPRNRLAAERMDRRSQAADEEFQKKFKQFKYRPQKSEQAEIGDATQQLLRARRKGLDESSAMLSRQLMRTGGSSELASVYKQSNDQYAQSLVDAMLQGKRLGKESYNQQQQTDMQNMGGELNFLKGIADQTTTSPVAQPQIGNQLTQRSDNALSQLIQAIMAGHGPSQSAHNQLASGLANSGLDLSGVASMLSQLDFGYGETEDDDTASQPYDPWAGLR